MDQLIVERSEEVRGYAESIVETVPKLLVILHKDLRVKMANREIKSDAALRRIPVIVLTTSKAEEDIYRTYDLGANSFITKPVLFESLVRVMKDLGKYWFEIVELPAKNVGD